MESEGMRKTGGRLAERGMYYVLGGLRTAKKGSVRVSTDWGGL